MREKIKHAVKETSRLEEAFFMAIKDGTQWLFPALNGSGFVAIALSARELEGKGLTPSAKDIFDNLRIDHEHDARTAIVSYLDYIN